MPAADQANASQADPPGLTFSVSVSALQHLIIEVLRRPVEFTENTPPKSEYARDERLDVLYLLDTLNAVTAADHADKILVTDVGNHQMWAAQRLEITGPNSFLTSAGIGTMGSGLPQALGAQLAQPDRLVIDIQGDEGFFCCGSELRTAARYALPIKVLIINNGSQCTA